MPRGGKRLGAGRKSAWINKETQLIRVPKVLAQQILQYAHELDEKVAASEAKRSHKPASRQMDLLPVALDSATKSKNVPPMTLTALSERLGRHKSTLVGVRKQGSERLAHWSREKDPDGLEWEYREEDKLFYPVVF